MSDSQQAPSENNETRAQMINWLSNLGDDEIRLGFNSDPNLDVLRGSLPTVDDQSPDQSQQPSTE